MIEYSVRLAQEVKMDVVSAIIYNVGIFFIMMIPGIILKKCNMISDGFGKGLSNLVLYIAQPALVFLAYVKDFDKNILINSIYVFIFSIICHFLFSVCAMLVFKKTPDSKARMLKFATIFSNAAFLGIPLINAVLEKQYPGATLYASIYNITFNLFLWSLGVRICTENRDENENGVSDYKEEADRIASEVGASTKAGGSILKALKHPVTIAAALGLVFFILPINGYIPKIVIESLTMLKNLVAPLSMVVIGIRLADMDFRGAHRDKYMYIFLALRHIALPLVVILLIKLIELIGIPTSTVAAMVVVIMASAPAASSATMFAEKYRCDSAYVSRIVTISTILSIATMPLMIFIFGLI